MGFAGLPRATLTYLSDLAQNNRREWFEKHRDRYRAEWLEPGLDLAAALAPLGAAMHPALTIVPRLNAGLRRLHRDLRFSADKRPYAPQMHLVLSAEGAGGRHTGFHIVIEPAGLSWGAGSYRLAPDALARFRARLCDPADAAALRSAIASAGDTGSRLDPPDLARPPMGFAARPDVADLARHQSVIVRTPAPVPVPDWIFTPEAPDRLAALARPHLPLLAWLSGSGATALASGAESV